MIESKEVNRDCSSFLANKNHGSLKKNRRFFRPRCNMLWIFDVLRVIKRRIEPYLRPRYPSKFTCAVWGLVDPTGKARPMNPSGNYFF